MTSQRAGQLQNQWSSLCLETLLEAEFAMMGRGRSMYFWTPSVGFDPGPPKDMGPNKGPILFPYHSRFRIPKDMGLEYLPRFTISLRQMYVNIPVTWSIWGMFTYMYFGNLSKCRICERISRNPPWFVGHLSCWSQFYNRNRSLGFFFFLVSLGRTVR